MPGAAPFPASEPNPAERYAASRRRRTSPQLTEFAAGYPFGLDEFQREGCEAIEAGEGVLVAAPTGAGKTVVGEFAVFLALATGRKCFYTTPIKALSNQKFHDLVARHGEENVGLLTGDTTIRGEAPVVVMTTEVLRNMLYAGSGTLAGLGFVVMDEVHYLSDRFRGAVWEEVIIHLAEDVQVVSLSATVSNAEEFGAWLAEVRGGTRIVVTEHRPVPLWQHVLAGPRMYDLFAPPPAPPSTVNPALTRLAREEIRRPAPSRGPRDRQRPRPGLFRPPSRADVITALDIQGMLPAITFIFSRAGCDAAVRQCVHAGVRLTTPEERTEIRRLVDERTTDLPDADLRVLGYWEWLEALERGVAAHHAGLLPLFKTVVEELFSRGLVRAVFATETLALGINMPARTVVLESLSKWNGESHADITPGEYTQLTGRAGRRGIDVEGHAVVLWRPGFDPRQVGGLASARTYPLRSSFRPSYNMAVNLVAQVGRGDARTLLEQSFAQFQADRSVVGLARQVSRADEALAGYLESAHCDKGDIREYDAIRRALSAREAEVARTRSAAGRAAAAHALESLRPGAFNTDALGRRAGVAVVLASGDPGPTVLTGDRHVRRLTPVEVPTAPEVLGRIRIPKSFQPRSPQARRDLVSTLRAQGFLDRIGPNPHKRDSPGADAEITRLRTALRAHPAHGCADRANHLRWLVRAQTLERETDSLRRRVESRTGSVAKVFDQVCAVLSDLHYLDGDQVTASGHPLAKIYNESDLVVAECIRQGRWEGLDPATLAAVVSAVVYEARRDDAASPPPPNSAREALRATEEIYNELSALEAEHRLTTLRAPDSGLARAIHAWANGAQLESVLGDGDLLPGDFVRWCKQVVDLLGQIAAIPGHQVADTARKAARLLDRGVVSYA
jgi:ATP-dependent RNA helicase HelY